MATKKTAEAKRKFVFLSSCAYIDEYTTLYDTSEEAWEAAQTDFEEDPSNWDDGGHIVEIVGFIKKGGLTLEKP